MNLYRPTDVAAANDRHGATCGHAALAAILGREVSDVWQAARHEFEGRAYVSAPAMENALAVLRPGNWRPAANVPAQGAGPWPARGLVLVQIQGPWMAPGLPFGAQLAHTHWVAKDGPAGADAWIYDINADAWVRRSTWESMVMPAVLAHHKRSTGWYVRRAYEVQPAFDAAP